VIADVDEEDEVTVGGFVPLNNDTDDPEDDRVSLGLAVAPGLTSGEVQLAATAEGTKIEVWTAADGGTEVSLPETWDLAEDELPALHVEGMSGSAVRDVELTLSYTLDEEMLSDDKVKITVWDFEIEKCPSEWLPTYDSTVDIAATLTPGGVNSTIYFYLLSSHEPGFCMNAWTESTDDDVRDLQFLAGENSAFDVGAVPPPLIAIMP